MGLTCRGQRIDDDLQHHPGLNLRTADNHGIDRWLPDPSVPGVCRGPGDGSIGEKFSYQAIRAGSPILFLWSELGRRDSLLGGDSAGPGKTHADSVQDDAHSMVRLESALDAGQPPG